MTWTDATGDQLHTATNHGIEYALAEIANGNEGPRESPLSGEWADDLTPRMVAENAGYYEGLSAHGEAYYDQETALADAWEDGYRETWANHLAQ